jgi:hypothetical protein
MSWQVTGSFTWNETVWNPSMISTALWLDAADASTITESSGAVSQWNDKSGNGRHLAQADANFRPLLVSNSFNNRPSLQFDGIDDRLANTAVGLPQGASARSLFAVYRPNRTTDSNGICGQGGTAATATWYMLQFREFLGDPYFAGFSRDVGGAPAITLAPKLAAAVYSGSNLSLYSTGALVNSMARALNTTGNSFQAGSSPASVEHMMGNLAEVVFVSSEVTTATRQRIEGYLAHKWGLTANLPNDHPYKTVGPTP